MKGRPKCFWMGRAAAASTAKWAWRSWGWQRASLRRNCGTGLEWRKKRRRSLSERESLWVRVTVSSESSSRPVGILRTA